LFFLWKKNHESLSGIKMKVLYSEKGRSEENRVMT
jgi:hypothetical protein